MCGVAVGVMVGGVSTAWLTVMCRFPGRRLLRMGAAAADGGAGVRDGLCVYRFPAVRGPVQTWLRELTGWGAREYWFPEVRSVERRGGDALVRALSVRLSARALGVSRAVGQHARSRARVRLRRRGARSCGSLCRSRARHRRGHRARADGDARRFRHGRLFRRARRSPPASFTRGSRWATAWPRRSFRRCCWVSSSSCCYSSASTRARARFHTTVAPQAVAQRLPLAGRRARPSPC